MHFLKMNLCSQGYKGQIKFCELLLPTSSYFFNHCLLPKHYDTISSVSFSECETWLLKLRYGHRFKVYENKTLRRISGSKGEEETQGWRKLCNVKFLKILLWREQIMIVRGVPPVAHVAKARNL
jgi:hypothetical protein